MHVHCGGKLREVFTAKRTWLHSHEVTNIYQYLPIWKADLPQENPTGYPMCLERLKYIRFGETEGHVILKLVLTNC